MIDFIKKPNLPSGEVKSLICGVLCRELEDFLDDRQIKRYTVTENPYIDFSVATHADMLSLHIKDKKFIVDSQQVQLIDELKKDGANVIKTAKAIRGEYPKDIALNFALVGEHVFGKLSHCDENLLKELNSFKRCNCAQGYSKCSVLVVNEDALITDDSTIYKVASKQGKSCLLIDKGDVSLPGHEYGFIGGASAKISKDEVLFFGDITKHRDYEKIESFLFKHHCQIISLDFPLRDFGGFVLVKEKT